MRLSIGATAFIAGTLFASVLNSGAFAQGFASGLTLPPIPVGLQAADFVQLSKDGTALGVRYSGAGRIITPFDTRDLPAPSAIDDLSLAGEYTVEYAIRRDADGNAQTLMPGLTATMRSTRSHISADGSVVAGSRETTFSLPDNAFRWTATGGGQFLGAYTLGAPVTTVQDLSGDGSTIVGGGSSTSGRAWKWTESAGYAILPASPNIGTAGATARATTFDGSIIVGDESHALGGRHGVVWQAGSITVIPNPSTFRTCVVSDVSDDGSVIVGALRDSVGSAPSSSAIWTQASGWLPLRDFMLMHGIAIPSVYAASSAQMDVSADGQTFAALLLDTRTNRYVPAIFVIPSPAAWPVLGLLVALRRRRTV